MVNGLIGVAWLQLDDMVLKKKRGARCAPLFENKPRMKIRFELLARCLNVDVDFLRSAAPEKTAPIDKEQYQNDDHENRKYGDNSCTAAAATIFSHEGILLRKGIKLWGL